MRNDFREVKSYLAHFGISGQKKGLRRFQSYQVAPTRSGMVGQEVGEAAKQSSRLSKLKETAKTAAKNYKKEVPGYLNAYQKMSTAPGELISARHRGHYNKTMADLSEEEREKYAQAASRRFALDNAIRDIAPNYLMPTKGSARMKRAMDRASERYKTLKDAKDNGKSYSQAKLDRQKAKVDAKLKEKLEASKRRLKQEREELKLMQTDPKKWAYLQDDIVDDDNMKRYIDWQKKDIKKLENDIKQGGDPYAIRNEYVKAGIYHKLNKKKK